MGKFPLLIVLGFVKSFFTYVKWYKSSFETLMIGAAAAGASYFIGKAFEGIAAEQIGHSGL